MATTIKTKVLLPRASWNDWQSSSRVLQAGELVLAYDGTGKFRLFEGDGKTFAEGTKELKLDASQVVLSSDAEITLQQAIEDLSGNLTAYVEKSALSIGYDSTAKKIYLSGGTNVSEIDASDFIKDGMLSAATYDANTCNIILTFNTDAGATPISVDVGALVDTYTIADTGTIDLEMSSNQISASIKEDAITPYHLSADAGWVFDCNE